MEDVTSEPEKTESEGVFPLAWLGPTLAVLLNVHASIFRIYLRGNTAHIISKRILFFQHIILNGLCIWRLIKSTDRSCFWYEMVQTTGITAMLSIVLILHTDSFFRVCFALRRSSSSWFVSISIISIASSILSFWTPQLLLNLKHRKAQPLKTLSPGTPQSVVYPEEVSCYLATSVFSLLLLSYKTAVQVMVIKSWQFQMKHARSNVRSFLQMYQPLLDCKTLQILAYTAFFAAYFVFQKHMLVGDLIELVVPSLLSLCGIIDAFIYSLRNFTPLKNKRQRR